MRLRTAVPRSGLTLLEVIVAMAIFLMSIAAIFQLLSLGNDRAVDAKLKAKTSLRCQSKLSEIIVGAQDLTSTGSYNACTDDPDMQWKMEATQATAAGLYTVKVFVKVDLPTGKSVESQLIQMILDPKTRGSTVQPTTTTP